MDIDKKGIARVADYTDNDLARKFLYEHFAARCQSPAIGSEKMGLLLAERTVAAWKN